MKPPNNPIPAETLKDILARRKDDPEVVALLWEIWRLKRIAVTAHAFAIDAPRFDQTRNLLADKLLNMTKDEPAVIQHREWIAGLLKRPE